MIDDLLNALENYRSMMKFKGKDFDGDRNSQYTAIRKELCQKYEECFEACVFVLKFFKTMNLSIFT